MAMSAPLFILSFRHRDELIRLAGAAGWEPIAARRADNAEARFVASGAAVAVVDARGALGEGVEAVRAIGDAAEANAAAMLPRRAWTVRCRVRWKSIGAPVS